jgi:hypothetical protein
MPSFTYKTSPKYRNVVGALGATIGTSTGGYTVATQSVPSGEVLVAIKNLSVKNAVAYPTFTAVQTATTHYVTGQVLTVTVTPSKAVAVSGLPTIALAIPTGTKQAVFNRATSTSTSLNFDYTFVVGDVAASAIPIAGAIVSQAGYSITMAVDASGSSEIVPTTTFTALVSSGVTVN